MKKLAIIGLLAVGLTGCSTGTSARQSSNSATTAPASNERMQSVASHTTENQLPPNTDATPPANANSVSPANTGGKTKWTQSGNPIDTKELDAKIATAEKNLKSKPKDAAAKTALSGAFFDRGFALTEARQYASALGDFRRALKHDPANSEAQKWMDQIISIYNTINKDFPKEGEEPPALPFKGEK